MTDSCSDTSMKVLYLYGDILLFTLFGLATAYSTPKNTKTQDRSPGFLVKQLNSKSYFFFAVFFLAVFFFVAFFFVAMSSSSVETLIKVQRHDQMVL